MIKQVPNPVIEIHDLAVSYEKKPILWNIDLSLPAGNLVGLIGPNGAGKSTLIKAMMGLIHSDSGYCKLFNQELDTVRNKIAYVPQRSGVDWDFPATVFDVALMGCYGKLGLFQRASKRDKELTLNCLAQVGIENLKDRQIAQLSGGQQQRVFIARALVQDADLYIMDEPFAGVDMATENAILLILRKLRDAGKTLLIVHHDLRTAPDYFDWLILLNQRLVASGKTKEVFTNELLQETYSGRLTILSEVGQQIQNQQFPRRE